MTENQQQDPVGQQDPVAQVGDAVARTAETIARATSQVVNSMLKFTDQFSNTRTKINSSDAVGKEAEVSVAVPPGGTGEVILSLGGSLRHYPARGRDGRRAFKRGEIVRVVEAGSNTLYVTDS